MSFLRVAAIRSGPSAFCSRTAIRAVRRTASQPCLRIGQQGGHRGYASATDAVKKTSDLPWAVTATVVTAVGTYIALSPSDDAGHGHDTHHEGQGHSIEGDRATGQKEHAKEDSEDATQEESKEEPDAEATDDSSEKSESKDEDKSGEEEKSSKDESKSSDEKKTGSDGQLEDDKTNVTEDQGAKGDTQKGATKQQDDIKHREEDSGKKSTKVRIDSPAQKSIGEGVSSGDGDDYAKTAQKGISNTDTRHSTDPNADPTKSSKGEGTADTAKVKGTVQPDRPQV